MYTLRNMIPIDRIFMNELLLIDNITNLVMKDSVSDDFRHEVGDIKSHNETQSGCGGKYKPS